MKNINKLAIVPALAVGVGGVLTGCTANKFNNTQRFAEQAGAIFEAEGSTVSDLRKAFNETPVVTWYAEQDWVKAAQNGSDKSPGEVVEHAVAFQTEHTFRGNLQMGERAVVACGIAAAAIDDQAHFSMVQEMFEDLRLLDNGDEPKYRQQAKLVYNKCLDDIKEQVDAGGAVVVPSRG